MIELLLAAERMVATGDLDHAERLFSQVAAVDPQNAIAVMGLAEVAAARGDDAGAAAMARRALEIDPDNAAAKRMLDRVEGVIATRAGRSSPIAESGRSGGGPSREVHVAHRRSFRMRVAVIAGLATFVLLAIFIAWWVAGGTGDFCRDAAGKVVPYPSVPYETRQPGPGRSYASGPRDCPFLP